MARLELATGDAAAAALTAARAADRLRRQRRAPWVARAVLVAQQASGAPDPRVLRQVAAVLDDAGLVHDAVEAHLAAGRAAAARDDHDARGPQPDARRPPGPAGRRCWCGSADGSLSPNALCCRANRSTSVVRSCRQGLDDLAAHRLALPSAELRALASGHGVELATLGLRALLPHASPARVLGWLELMRAAAIGGASTAQAPQDEHLARLRALHAELDEARSRAEPEPAALLAQVAQVEDTLRRAAWTVDGAVDLTRRVGLAELRERLRDRVLVEYAELDGRLVAVVAGRRPVRTVDLGPVAPVARAIVAAALRAAPPGRAGAPRGPRAAGARLRAHGDHAARGPARPPARPRPGDAPGRGAGRRPAAGAVARPARRAGVGGAVRVGLGHAPPRRPPTRWRRDDGVVLVAGPGLPGAQDEVARLARVHPGARVLSGDGAGAARVLGALAGSRLAHLSCHGTVRSDSPTFSSLQMADGPLTLHEILSGGTAPRCVVLAACDSAVEATYPGDEPLGFVSALLGHGARAVVASTVLVPDLAAVPMMVRLHEGLARGESAGDALHAARQQADTGSPAGFVASCAFTAFGAG